jgi:hypothetical protein
MAPAATVGPNSGDFGHRRAQDLGGKERGEGGGSIPCLTRAEMHCRDRISRRKMQERVCSSVLGGWLLCSGGAGSGRHRGERSSWWCASRRGGGAGAALEGRGRTGGCRAAGLASHGYRRRQQEVADAQRRRGKGCWGARGTGSRGQGRRRCRGRRQGKGRGVGGQGARAQVPRGEEREEPWATACREPSRGSQVGFIWAQGLGYRGKAACRRSRLERGLDLWIFIAHLVNFYRAKRPGSA